MILARVVLIAALALAAPVAATAADDILDAIDQARKSYQDGNYTAAKQSLDLASQLVGQKNAEILCRLAAGGAARLEGREGGNRRCWRRHVRRLLGEPPLSLT